MFVDFLGGADSSFGGFPPEYVLLIIRDQSNSGDGLNCMIIKSVRQHFQVPAMSARDP
jgi:hypothetical protein